MEIKAVIGETDMLQTMQQDALLLAGKALDLFDVNESTQIASFIKKVQKKYTFYPHSFLLLIYGVLLLQEFDQSYGPGWQCIVGTDFGSFVTHHRGWFIYFSIGSLMILFIRATLAPEVDTTAFIAMESIGKSMNSSSFKVLDHGVYM
ncbi:hypothetical protein BHE74_00042806 [Ensete ventricosum]|nr:hypothetical protein BHE74_00042806 [Ensete ventricosum]